MSLIKCEECGKEISDKAKSCPNCGNPMEKDESKVIVYGLTQMLIGGKLKIYIDDEYAGEVKKGEKLELPIDRNCTITAKCGINPIKGKIDVKAGETTKIKFKYNRLTGGFIPSIVDIVSD